MLSCLQPRFVKKKQYGVCVSSFVLRKTIGTHGLIYYGLPFASGFDNDGGLQSGKPWERIRAFCRANTETPDVVGLCLRSVRTRWPESRFWKARAFGHAFRTRPVRIRTSPSIVEGIFPGPVGLQTAAADPNRTRTRQRATQPAEANPRLPVVPVVITVYRPGETAHRCTSRGETRTR